MKRRDQKIKTLSEQVASIKSQMEAVLNAIASIDSTVGKSQVAETLVKNGVYQAFTNSSWLIYGNIKLWRRNQNSLVSDIIKKLCGGACSMQKRKGR